MTESLPFQNDELATGPVDLSNLGRQLASGSWNCRRCLGLFLDESSLLSHRCCPRKQEEERPEYIVTEEIPEWADGRAAQIAQLIMGQFKLGKSQVSGDDIIATIEKMFPGNSARVSGCGFQYLAKRGKIRRVGDKPTSRAGAHARPVRLWELVPDANEEETGE